MTRRVPKSLVEVPSVVRKLIEDETSNRFEVKRYVIPGSTRLLQVSADDEDTWEGKGAVYELVAGAFVVLEPPEYASSTLIDTIRNDFKTRGALEVFVRPARRGKVVPDGIMVETAPTRSVREHATELLVTINSKDKPALEKLVDKTLAKRGF